MNQNHNDGLWKIRHNWGKCLEALGFSERQCFELANVPQKPCFLNLDHPDLFKLLHTFNLSLDILESGQICLNTLVKQLRGEVAFSKRALGNLGSRPQVILKLGARLERFEFRDILASFQLSEELLLKADTYLSAEIVEKLADRISQNKLNFFWIKESAEENFREALGDTKRDRKTFLDFVDHGVSQMEKNFDYKIERSSPKQIIFSYKENEKTLEHFGKSLQSHCWSINMQYSVEAYFDGMVEVRPLRSTSEEEDRNKFEVDFR